MKLFLIYPDRYEYDCYDGVVIVADSPERALEIAKTGDAGHSYFREFQGEIHVNEVDLCKEGVILESYNAG
jgi:hypothetical protein